MGVKKLLPYLYSIKKPGYFYDQVPLSLKDTLKIFGFQRDIIVDAPSVFGVHSFEQCEKSKAIHDLIFNLDPLSSSFSFSSKKQHLYLVVDGIHHPLKNLHQYNNVGLVDVSNAVYENPKMYDCFEPFSLETKPFIVSEATRSFLFSNKRASKDDAKTPATKKRKVRVINALYEGESCAAGLSMLSERSVVVSKDSDSLVLGAFVPDVPVILPCKGNRENSDIKVWYPERILDHFNLSASQFRDACILGGTDFSPSIMSIKKAIECAQTHFFKNNYTTKTQQEDKKMSILEAIMPTPARNSLTNLQITTASFMLTPSRHVP